MIKIQELLSYQAPELKQRLAGMGARAETGKEGDHHRRKADRDKNIGRGLILNARRVHPGRAARESDPPGQTNEREGATAGRGARGRQACHRSRSKKLKGKAITMQAKVEGRVKWFDPIRGYGFAVRLDGGGDVFLHHRRLLDAPESMEKGAAVLFGILDDPKGPVAVDVEIVGSSDKNKKETGSCIL